MKINYTEAVTDCVYMVFLHTENLQSFHVTVDTVKAVTLNTNNTTDERVMDSIFNFQVTERDFLFD